MSDSLDGELISILNKLRKIEKRIGIGKEKENKRFGKGDNIDKFADLKYRIEIRLEELKGLIADVKRIEKAPGSNPTEIISQQSKVRSEQALLNDEWKELDNVYRLETRKKRSKLSPEELAERQDVLVRLQLEIREIKEMQRANYVPGYQMSRIVEMKNSEMFRPSAGTDGKPGSSSASTGSKSGGISGSRNNNMTEQHAQQLMTIRSRDQEIDREIELIGEGVDILGELARSANEEVKLQNRMLDSLEAKMDNVSEHVNTVNETLKETLEQARKSDKICMDIFCVLLLIGMIIVVVKVNQDNSK